MTKTINKEINVGTNNEVEKDTTTNGSVKKVAKKSNSPVKRAEPKKAASKSSASSSSSGVSKKTLTRKEAAQLIKDRFADVGASSKVRFCYLLKKDSSTYVAAFSQARIKLAKESRGKTLVIRKYGHGAVITGNMQVINELL